MSQQTALIVHQLMDNPESFVEKDGVVSNGYYSVSIDGSRYGMGISMYQADGTDRQILEKAMAEWKEDTGWAPKEITHKEKPVSGRVIISPEVFIRQAYEEFSKSIRSHYRSFVVHSDANVLSIGIQQAIAKLDQAMCPMEKIEGKKSNAQEGGVSSS